MRDAGKCTWGIWGLSSGGGASTVKRLFLNNLGRRKFRGFKVGDDYLLNDDKDDGNDKDDGGEDDDEEDDDEDGDEDEAEGNCNILVPNVAPEQDWQPRRLTSLRRHFSPILFPRFPLLIFSSIFHNLNFDNGH